MGYSVLGLAPRTTTSQAFTLTGSIVGCAGGSLGRVLFARALSVMRTSIIPQSVRAPNVRIATRRSSVTTAWMICSDFILPPSPAYLQHTTGKPALGLDW